MAVVTISRQFGAGAYLLGKQVAERLGYQLIDRNLVHQIALEAKVSIEWVEAVEKEAGGLLVRLAHSLVSDEFIRRHIGETHSDFDEEKYIKFLKKLLVEAANQGGIVILGRGAQFILADRKDTLKVLLVAAFEDRVRAIMEPLGLNRERAEEAVRREDRRRMAFLRLINPGSPEDPSHYSVVINTSQVSLKDAENMVCSLAGSLIDANAKPI